MVRFVIVREVKYLRADDVFSYIRQIAASEETDVRNRFNRAALEMGAEFAQCKHCGGPVKVLAVGIVLHDNSAAWYGGKEITHDAEV